MVTITCNQIQGVQKLAVQLWLLIFLISMLNCYQISNAFHSRNILQHRVDLHSKGIIIGDKSNLGRISEPIRGSSSELSMVIKSTAFNPLLRRKNIKVLWHEADLATFYNFVEQQPLLTKEQELRYGKAIAMSLHMDEKLRGLEESQGEEFETIEDVAKEMRCAVSTLEKIIRYGEIARRRLHDSNLKLVLAVVSRYRSSDIPLQELIAVGSRGLARAVVRYDFSKGFRFATYATWYVHQAVADYVRWTKHPAKMPSKYLLLQRKMKQFVREFKKEHPGELPTAPEVAKFLNVDEIDVVKVSQMNTYPMFTSQYLDDANDKPVSEFIPSVMSTPMKRTNHKEERRDFEELMESKLNEVERDVLRLRLGLDDGRVKAVKEVGKKFKISWKKVSVVEKEAITKLRESKDIKEVAVASV